MKKITFSASYTVEASYIMAIVLLSLSCLIQTAFVRCREAVGTMRLHQVVEQLRGQEKEQQREWTIGQGAGQAERLKDKAVGRTELPGGEKEIWSSIHAPEDMMRMMTIFDEKEKSQGSEH